MPLSVMHSNLFGRHFEPTSSKQVVACDTARREPEAHSLYSCLWIFIFETYSLTLKYRFFYLRYSVSSMRQLNCGCLRKMRSREVIGMMHSHAVQKRMKNYQLCSQTIHKSVSKKLWIIKKRNTVNLFYFFKVIFCVISQVSHKRAAEYNGSLNARSQSDIGEARKYISIKFQNERKVIACVAIKNFAIDISCTMTKRSVNIILCSILLV